MQQRSNAIGKLLKRSETYLAIIIIVLMAGIAVKTQGVSLHGDNLWSMFLSNIYITIVAMGMLVVVIAAGIDLSCFATATVAQFVMGLYLHTENANMLGCFAIVIGIGLVLGAVNGMLVYQFRVPSMIITIATMNTYYGVLQWATNGKNLFGFPQWFSKNGPLGYGFAVIVLAVIVALTWFILTKTKIGRNVFAIGGNMEAVSRAGVNVFATQMFVYSYIGVLSGIAGLVQLYLIRNYSPNTLVGNELDIVVMVVIGGASLLGGKGTVFGTILGVILLAVINNGLVLMNVSSYDQSFVTGAVILVGLIVITYFNLRKPRQKKLPKAGEA